MHKPQGSIPLELITPKSAIDRVLAHKAKSSKLTLYDTKFEKLLLSLTSGLVVIGAIVGAGAAYSGSKFWELTALLLVFAAEISFIVYQLVSLIPDLLKLRNPERSFIAPYGEVFNDDVDLIAELASCHDEKHLRYAAQYFALSAEQLRTRIGLLVGAIEKVGLIPLGVTTYLSITKLAKEGAVFGGAEWFLLGLILFYLFSVRMGLVAQWLDRTALLFRAAVESKR